MIGYSRLFPRRPKKGQSAASGSSQPRASVEPFFTRLNRHLRRTLPYLRPYTGFALVTALGYGVMTVIGLLEPWPFKILVDSALQRLPLPAIVTRFAGGLTGHPGAILLFAVLAQFALTMLANAVGVVNSYAHTKLEQSMSLDFRSDLFKHAQNLSLAFHDKRQSGLLIYVINSLGSAVPSFLMTILPLAQSALTLVGMFWISLKLDASLALVSLVVVPFLYYSVGYYSRNIKQPIQQVRAMEGEALSIVHEVISMLRVMVAFGREAYEYRRFRDQGERSVDARVGLTVRQTLFSLAVNATTAAGSALVLGLGAYHVMTGRLTVGELLVVISYVASVYSPLESISTTVGSLQEQFVDLEMAFDFLDTKPEIKSAPGAVALERAFGQVTFENVVFSYQDRDATLKNISFDVDAGDVVGIVGPTGAGKTTLASLIPRFYDVTGGRILLDGLDVRTLTVESLRNQISIVLQEPLLFSTTIAENIRYGRLDATMDEVMAAARAAGAHEFISALPDQYESVVGERGAQLSGGERQRIAVARAFLKNAPILILDEPTSSIDSKTEQLVLEALDRLMAGRTTFLIAHRLSTIRHARTILVLSHGRLVQQGSHDELVREEGLYRQLYEMQSGHVRRHVRKAIERAVSPVEVP